MKIYAKMDPKSDPKIDIWALRGRIFAILGGFWRSPIFDEFSIGKMSIKILQKFEIWARMGVRSRSLGVRWVRVGARARSRSRVTPGCLGARAY